MMWRLALSRETVPRREWLHTALNAANDVMDRDERSADEWKHLPWKSFERQVFKLQKRIYRASRRGDVTTVHHLQRFLMRSWAAKCLAVRKVTQDNRGKKTAGVDGVKNLTPCQRLDLAQHLTPHI